MTIVQPSINCIDVTLNAMTKIETCARIAYQSESNPETQHEFIRRIIRRGHESVLEHAIATFLIVCDRGISHEIVRHRIGMSYTQESTRYVKYDDLHVIRPSTIPVGYASDLWFTCMKDCEDAYTTICMNGVSPQIARSVLPTCLATQIAVTGNFRSWRHFLKLRTAAGAHPDMRVIAMLILAWFVQHYPVIVEDIGQ